MIITNDMPIIRVHTVVFPYRNIMKTKRDKNVRKFRAHIIIPYYIKKQMSRKLTSHRII